jgi:pimeloyl-ACP methyl ester carboxylesterase
MSAVLATLAVAAGGLPVAAAGTAVDAPAGGVARHAASDEITWEACPELVTVETAECGRVDVPMYHADPDGAQISVGFVRIPASDPDSRRGALFGNPGGPGGDGYSFFGYDGEGAMSWPEELRSEWDLVAVQPRGLTGSTPVDCDHDPGFDPVRAQLEPGAYLKAACETGTPGYTDALNTSETADDWDDVRAALGEDSISLLGLSYGTHLASTYATKYPDRTDRTVLDSGFDTKRAWAGVLDDQSGGYTGALHDFLQWTADNNDTYGLGETPLEVYRAWSRVVVEESGTNPTVVPPPAQVGDLPQGLQWAGQPAADVLTATGHPRAQLENLFRMVSAPGAVQSTSMTLALTRMMLPSPNSWGTLAGMVAGTEDVPDIDELAAQAQDPSATVPVYMQAMVICNENQVAPDYTRIPGAVWNGMVVQDPFLAPGDMAAAGISCSGTTPDAPFVDINGDGLDTRPLQIQGTGDPQTVYRTHRPMAEAMNSHVITVDGPGHAQVGVGNTVVDDAVVEYLRTGHTDVTSAPSRPIG